MTVRFGPPPPKIMPVCGTRFVSDELAETAKLPGAVSRSPIVKERAGVDESSSRSWSAIFEMVGRLLPPVTVSIPEALLTV